MPKYRKQYNEQSEQSKTNENEIIDTSKMKLKLTLNSKNETKEIQNLKLNKNSHLILTKEFVLSTMPLTLTSAKDWTDKKLLKHLLLIGIDYLSKSDPKKFFAEPVRRLFVCYYVCLYVCY